ncbi:MAG TPA: hypothetical protein DD429_10755 [Clostridiaceae bacterium]|nr:hypothetical protein [Clostridiaceae bacterium]
MKKENIKRENLKAIKSAEPGGVGMIGTQSCCPKLKQLLPDRDLPYDIRIMYGIDMDETEQTEAMFYLEKSDDSETHLVYISGLYDYITGRGFKRILKLCDAADGKYYMCRDDGIYLLYEYPGLPKFGFSFSKNGSDMMMLLAKFHKYSEGYVPPPGGKAKSCWGRWIEEYKKEYAKIKKYCKQVDVKADKSAFENRFLSSRHKYMERMENSISLLKNKGYLYSVEESMRKRQICMESFKQSNFFSVGHDMYIKSLGKCKYDIREKDIAELLGKLICSYRGKDNRKLIKLVDEYDSVNMLNSNSIDIIKAFLMFPEEYIKVCSKYMEDSSRRSEVEYIEKLMSAMSADNKKAKLAETLQ